MSSEFHTLTGSLQEQVNDICERFQAAWKSRLPPRIEDYLTAVAEEGQPLLLRELVQIDVDYRRKQGENPQPAHYGKRFALLDEQWLARLFPASAGSVDDTPPLATGTDRDLLFGIAALSRDFIQRNALMAAMHAWGLDKKKSLGQILVEQGTLTAEAQKLLDAVVAKHIEAHNNDSEESLTAVQGLGAVLQGGLEPIADPDVTTPQAGAVPPRKTAPPVNGSEGAVYPRFHIKRFHARGGLGEVSVAQDNQLHREVALKEIQQKYADDPESQRRFVQEAEITGGLEHPGIVPVYALETDADGRPYYVMRFIRGETLKDAIRDFHGPANRSHAGKRSLEFRQLLRRLVVVCETVGYAHSRSVLHRDLKPGNIMLGKYGETLVVDWGLAKPIGRAEQSAAEEAENSLCPPSQQEVTPTQIGAAVGTYPFMSPEQAAGQVDQLTVQSDVYSLGATLYVLLTGKVPVEGGNAREFLDKIKHGKIVPPRQVNKDTPSALQAVCLKAMALKPQDRYATALDMAADIESWLADEPVKAWREPWRTRLARWLRRHRSLVAGGVAVLVVAVIALTISTIVISKQQRETETARTTALESLNYLTEVAGEILSNTPTMEQHQQEMLKQALKLREDLVKDTPKGAKMRKQFAQDHHRLANVWHRLGYNQKAEEHFEVAIQLLADLPDVDAETRHRLAVAHTDCGDVLRLQSKYPEAARHLQIALDLQQPLEREFPSDAKYQLALARSYNILGLVKMETGEAIGADVALQSSLGRLRALVKERPTNREYLSDLGRVLVNLGVLYETNQNKKAETVYQEAIQRLEFVREKYPTRYEDQFKLAIACNNLGRLFYEIDPYKEDRFARAETVLKRAVALLERLVTDFPGNSAYRRELARSLYNLGYWYTEHAEAEQTMPQQLLIASTLGQQGSALGHGPFMAAAAASYISEYHTAEKAWLRATQSLQQLFKESSGTHADRHLLAQTLHNLAYTCLNQKEEREQAVQYLQQAIDEHRQALRLNHNDGYRKALAGDYRLLAETFSASKRHDKATQSINDLLKVCGDDPEQCYKAAVCLAECVSRAAADAKAAANYTEQAIGLLQRAVNGLYKGINLDDPDFAPLCANPRFQKLRQAAKKTK